MAPPLTRFTPLVFQIEDTIHDLTQDGKPVMAYVGELKNAWADLDHIAPLALPHSECVSTAKKWIEDRRVMVKGLNLAFEGSGAALMQLPKFHSLEEAIAVMAHEETWLKQIEKVEVVPKPAYYVSNRQETCDCHNCGTKGNLI
jgi:hypothetical protein